VTTKHEQDIETTRREERLLLSTMYEIGVKLIDRNIQETLELSQQNAVGFQDERHQLLIYA
jgi:hypothetical protein